MQLSSPKMKWTTIGEKIIILLVVSKPLRPVNKGNMWIRRASGKAASSMQKSKYGQWGLIVNTERIFMYCLLLCCESFNTFLRLFLYISPIILICTLYI